MRFKRIDYWMGAALVAAGATLRPGCAASFVDILGFWRVLGGLGWLVKEWACGCAIWHVAMIIVSAANTVISWAL
jgi:hypothetical protein